MKTKNLIFTLPDHIGIKKHPDLCQHCNKPCNSWKKEEIEYAYLRVEIEGNAIKGLKKRPSEIEWLVRYINPEWGSVEFIVRDIELDRAIAKMSGVIKSNPDVICE